MRRMRCERRLVGAPAAVRGLFEQILGLIRGKQIPLVPGLNDRDRGCGPFPFDQPKFLEHFQHLPLLRQAVWLMNWLTARASRPSSSWHNKQA